MTDKKFYQIWKSESKVSPGFTTSKNSAFIPYSEFINGGVTPMPPDSGIKSGGRRGATPAAADRREAFAYIKRLFGSKTNKDVVYDEAGNEDEFI